MFDVPPTASQRPDRGLSEREPAVSRLIAMLLGMLLVPGCKSNRAPRPTLDSLPAADTPHMAMRTLAAPLPSVKADTSRTADTTRWQDTTKLGDTAIQFSRGRVFRQTVTIRTVSTTVSVDSTWVVRIGYAVVGGIPFGLFAMWDSTTPKPNTQAFSMFYGQSQPYMIVGQFAAARLRKARMVAHLAGGARQLYLSRLPDMSTRDTTDSLLQFDMTKWKARLDKYNTPTLKAAINAAIADGTLIAGTVIDEPFNCGGPGNELNGWGCTLNSEGKRVVPVLTKARVDSMCVYQRQMFPNLPAGPFHDPDDFDVSHEYHECDFVVAQYRYAKGPLTTFRDQVLAFSRKNGTAPATAINDVDGGFKIAGCPKPQTGGPGSYGANCRMTPAQVRESGIVLGRIGCFLTGFKYLADMAADTAYRSAFKAVSDSLSRLPATPCRRAA